MDPLFLKWIHCLKKWIHVLKNGSIFKIMDPLISHILNLFTGSNQCCKLVINININILVVLHTIDIPPKIICMILMTKVKFELLVIQ